MTKSDMVLSIIFAMMAVGVTAVLFAFAYKLIMEVVK